MKIAYDCQGGDHAPHAIVRGALKAKTEDIEPVFYGDRDALIEIDGVDPEHIVHCSESILQEESPVVAIRRKKDSAIVRALADLKKGEVDGVVSAGSTGALLAGGMFIVKRKEGVERAALPVILKVGSQTKLLLDVGANVDVDPSTLLSFGHMGRDYLRRVEGVEDPTVSLLNIGTEEGKGNRQVKEAYELFKESMPNFVGNVEARDVLFKSPDVIVSDGFSGNILLKGMEGVIGYVQESIKTQLAGDMPSDVKRQIVDIMRNMLGQLDYQRYGGVPLLGLEKPVFKVHGSSDEQAIVAATERLVKMVQTM
ncbi:MAG: phosphate acyltransferase PlsX [Peptoniphilus sp.]|nr:phosphate acyltransferase PlsX [Peptoniphilus sp.]MDD7363868.1 phosphate acyltransferase PlsX [Bacillota bacterium]MDY6044293.1 phosphate acyltransferase PlsX [Peptoniphilus sp.]